MRPEKQARQPKQARLHAVAGEGVAVALNGSIIPYIAHQSEGRPNVVDTSGRVPVSPDNDGLDAISLATELERDRRRWSDAGVRSRPRSHVLIMEHDASFHCLLQRRRLIEPDPSCGAPMGVPHDSRGIAA
jgi:hypothetical protein